MDTKLQNPSGGYIERTLDMECFWHDANGCAPGDMRHHQHDDANGDPVVGAPGSGDGYIDAAESHLDPDLTSLRMARKTATTRLTPMATAWSTRASPARRPGVASPDTRWTCRPRAARRRRRVPVPIRGPAGAGSPDLQQVRRPGLRRRSGRRRGSLRLQPGGGRLGQ